MKGQNARQATIERVIAETRPHWESMNLAQRDSVIDRVCAGLGVTRLEAVERLSKPPCPHCGASDLDRGTAGPDVCLACGRFSRDGTAVA